MRSLPIVVFAMLALSGCATDGVSSNRVSDNWINASWEIGDSWTVCFSVLILSEQGVRMGDFDKEDERMCSSFSVVDIKERVGKEEFIVRVENIPKEGAKPVDSKRVYHLLYVNKPLFFLRKIERVMITENEKRTVVVFESPVPRTYYGYLEGLPLVFPDFQAVADQAETNESFFVNVYSCGTAVQRAEFDRMDQIRIIELDFGVDKRMNPERRDKIELRWDVADPWWETTIIKVNEQNHICAVLQK